MFIEIALSGKFIYDLTKRLIHDKVFRTLGFLVFVLVLIGTMFYWLVEHKTFIDGMHYAVGTLSMNSPSEGPTSTLGKIFDMIYRIIGVGVFLTFIMEAGKTIISAHHEFEKSQAEKKALKKEKKEAAKQAGK